MPRVRTLRVDVAKVVGPLALGQIVSTGHAFWTVQDIIGNPSTAVLDVVLEPIDAHEVPFGQAVAELPTHLGEVPKRGQVPPEDPPA